MREQLLADFLRQRVPAAELALNVAGSAKGVGEIGAIIEIEDMKDDLAVTPQMAVALCDAVLDGELPPEALEIIGFALLASDRFFWDGDENPVLVEVIHDWSAPEVNYPLTEQNVKRFRSWLTGEEPYPAKPTSLSGGRLISFKEKRRIERS